MHLKQKWLIVTVIVSINEISKIEGRVITDKIGKINIEEEDLILDVNKRRILTSPNILNISEKEALLDIHNMYRTKVSNGSTLNQPYAKNMNELLWDDGLAQVATNYANKCIWNHNGGRVNDLKLFQNISSFAFPSGLGLNVGENLFASSVNNINNIDTLLSGITAWYNEFLSYVFSTSYQVDAGHYTQLVWAKTRYVGCGFMTCPNLTGLTGPVWDDGAIIFVCDYFPAGNYAGQYPYINGSTIQDTCSSCDKDRNKCYENLCSGCVSSSYNANGSIIDNDCNNGLGIDLNSYFNNTSENNIMPQDYNYNRDYDSDYNEQNNHHSFIATQSLANTPITTTASRLFNKSSKAKESHN